MAKIDTLFMTTEIHIRWGLTYLCSPYKGVPAAGRRASTKVCKTLHGLRQCILGYLPAHAGIVIIDLIWIESYARPYKCAKFG